MGDTESGADLAPRWYDTITDRKHGDSPPFSSGEDKSLDGYRLTISMYKKNPTRLVDIPGDFHGQKFKRHYKGPKPFLDLLLSFLSC